MLNPTESETALRSGRVAAATARDVVVVDGPEAASYLNGQVSQNIEGLAVGDAAWTLLLEPVGRVTAWARASRVSEEEIWLDVDVGAGEAMLARLERFKLRTKADFSLRSAVVATAIRGVAAPSVEELRSALASAEAPFIVADLAWPKSTGADVLGLEVSAVGDLIGVEVGDPMIVELERIESGRPAMGREFGEKTIPAETGVVNHSADFTKGCYVGQELVARVDSRGNNTPRTVHPASIDSGTLDSGTVPEAGTEVTLDGEVVGAVTSAAARTSGVALLVSVKRGVEIPATLKVAVGGDVVDIAVGPVDWA